MRHLLPILLFLTQSSFAQNINDIRANFSEVSEFVDSESPRLKLDNTDEGGGSNFSFYSNGNRLYMIEENSFYEEGLKVICKFYFNDSNSLSFIFTKQTSWNYHGGEAKYKEDRIYVFEGLTIKRLQKSISDSDPQIVKEFIEKIDSIKNLEIEPEASEFIQRATDLKSIWHIGKKL